VLGLLLSSVPGLLPAHGERLLVRLLLGRFGIGVLSPPSSSNRHFGGGLKSHFLPSPLRPVGTGHDHTFIFEQVADGVFY
jgi:hypothetical protein